MQGIVGIYSKHKHSPCLKGAHSLTGGKICRHEEVTCSATQYINADCVVYIDWV